MIFFPHIGTYGRLGNQLFQYAAARSLSLERGTDLVVDSLASNKWHGQKCLLPHFNVNILEECDVSPLSLYEEADPFKIDKGFFDIPDNTLLRGFFQSIFYFSDYEDVIKKELQLKTRLSTFIKDLKSTTSKELVSIHLRRGDNTDGTDTSQSKLISHYDSGGPYETYLDKAVAEFPNSHFVMFTGGSRFSDDNSDDARWCQNFLESKGWKPEDYTISSGRSTMEDFELISSCDHNILSHVSSFGWWAAFLNINQTAKRVAPLNYHPDLKDYTHREMFYPTDWILL
tara:strand:- start:1201 stop:2058 length:858 start_codon:yes stop_codon:yes gene_type:complete